MSPDCRSRVVRALGAILIGLQFVTPARADVIDDASPPVPVLRDLAEPLSDAGIDVLYDHASEPGRTGPSFGDPARVAPLRGFRAWEGVEVDLDRYGAWLAAFASGARGALAAAPHDGDETRPDLETFERIWRDADVSERVLLSFDAADRATADRIATLLEERGYAVYLHVADPEAEPLDPARLGALFVSAGHHLTVDTASARLNPVIQFEAELLAELGRQRDWVASGEDELPPIKRGSMDVVESLGVLPMQVLPGGIVLGVRATLHDELAGAVPQLDHYGLELDGSPLVLEDVSTETRDAIRVFVASPESHSVVDIAGGRVTLAAPFEGTRIGGRMEHADRMPFDHLSVRGAQKSLIVDQGVRLRRHEDRVAADVTLEVRFYKTDDEGHAERLATLKFTVEDATGSARLLDLAWSRRAETRIRFDGDGVGSLTKSLDKLAIDAALIALARLESGTAAVPTSG